MTNTTPYPHSGDTANLFEYHMVKEVELPLPGNAITSSAVLEVHRIVSKGITRGIKWCILIPEMPITEAPAQAAKLGKAIATAVFKQIGITGDVPPYQVLSGQRCLYASSDDEQAVRLSGREMSFLFDELAILVMDDEGFTNIQEIDTAIAIARQLFALYYAEAPIAKVYAQAKLDAMVQMRNSLAEDAEENAPVEASDNLPVIAAESDAPLIVSSADGLALALTPGEAKLMLRQLWLSFSDALNDVEIDTAIQIARKLLAICDEADRSWASGTIENMEHAKAWLALSEDEQAALDGDAEGCRWQVSIRGEIGTEVIIRLKQGGEQEAIARALESQQWMSFTPATADYLDTHETATPLDAQCPHCQNWDEADYVRTHGHCHACPGLSLADSVAENVQQ